MTEALVAALLAHEAGLCVVPPKEDGSKAPITQWKRYQSKRPTEELLRGWYELEGRRGVGLVCGAVSGNLEMLEFEGQAVRDGLHTQYRELAEQVGVGQLLDRVLGGYTERTPGGGFHVFYRCEGLVEGNLKLARRPATAAELAQNPDDKLHVLIETRGEGGYVITAPSNGGVHPTGQAWVLLQGAFAEIATLTEEERECLLDLARSFDQMPKQASSNEHEPPSTTDSVPNQLQVRPGDDFNQRTTWASVLESHGWTCLFTASDGNQHWRRPGKSIGTSATVSQNGDGILYVFSTKTTFEHERGYTKFSAYAVLEHGGDFRAAARELGKLGYGSSGQSGVSSASQATPQTPDSLEELAAKLGPPPSFPVDALPEEVAGYVTALAESGLPADFAVLCCLGVLAAAIGGNASIRLSETWAERPALWLALVAGTGYRKSPTLREVRRPVDEVQRHHFQQWQALHDQWELLTRSGKKTEPEPTAVRLVADDSTLEALTMVLSQNAAGVALLVDELRTLIRGLGQYKHTGMVDRARLLSLWAGGPTIVDRVGRGTLFIPAPTLSIVGGIQPALLSELDGDDGLRERFLIAQSDASYRPPRMASGERKDDESLRNARLKWDQLVARIAARRQRTREIKLSKPAFRAFAKAHDRLMDLAEADEPAHVADWARKGPSHLARVLLVLIDASGALDEVRVEHVEKSERIIWYFAEHRRRLYLPVQNLLATPSEQATDRGVDKLLLALGQAPDGRLTRRDILRRAIAGVRTAEDVTRLLARYEATYPGCIHVETFSSKMPAQTVYHPQRRPK